MRLKVSSFSTKQISGLIIPGFKFLFHEMLYRLSILFQVLLKCFFRSKQAA